MGLLIEGEERERRGEMEREGWRGGRWEDRKEGGTVKWRERGKVGRGEGRKEGRRVREKGREEGRWEGRSVGG